jgi:hypothetical protein
MIYKIAESFGERVQIVPDGDFRYIALSGAKP